MDTVHEFADLTVGGDSDDDPPLDAAALSPDWRLLAVSRRWSGPVELWSTETGELVRELPRLPRGLGVAELEFSPDGWLLAGCAWNGGVDVWDLHDDGTLLSSHARHHGTARATFSTGQQWLATGSGEIWVSHQHSGVLEPGPIDIKLPFDADDELAPRRSGCFTWDLEVGSVHDLVFSPDAELLVAATEHLVQVFDTHTWTRTVEPMRGHARTVWSVTMAPDNRTIATGGGGEDRTVRLWDAVQGVPLGAALTGHTCGVVEVAFSPDSALLASADIGGAIRFWDVATGTQLGESHPHTAMVTTLSWSPDGRWLASASRDGTLRRLAPPTRRR